LKGAMYSINVKKKILGREKKMFTHFNERLARRDKMKCVTTKSYVKVI
jgi:hypothetical protein